MVTYIPTQAQNQTLATSQPTQADAERRREQELAWKAYKGKLQDALKVDKDQPNDNVKTNRSGPIADKSVSFLFNQVLKIECDEQAALDAFWGDDDDQMVRLAKLGMNGSICGQSFAKLIPSQEDNEPPRMVILNPMNIRIITLPDDCEMHVAYIIEYPTSSSMQKRQIISCVNNNLDIDDINKDDIQDTWTITNYIRKGAQGNWSQNGELEEWLYPFPPVFTCQNRINPNEPWGLSDLTPDLIDINKGINFILSNLARIIKYHGHPKTWIKGARAEQIRTAVDETLVFESPDAELGALAAMENFVGILNVVDDLRSSMDELSGVSAFALGRLKELPKGSISGVALRLLFQSLIEKTIWKQRLYGKLIREISRAALVLCGALTIEEYKNYKIDLHWQNLLPSDDLAAAQTAILLQQLGVSQDTLMQELGYDAEDEAKKSLDEDQKKMKAYANGTGLPPAQQDQQMVQQDQEMQQKSGEGNS